MEKKMLMIIGAIVVGIGAIFILITYLIPNDIIISPVEMFFGQASFPIMAIGLVLIFIGAPSSKIRGIILIVAGLIFVALAIYAIILFQKPGMGLAAAYIPMFIIISLVLIIPGILLLRKKSKAEAHTELPT